MKYTTVFILLILFSPAVFAQKTRPATKPVNSAAKNAVGEKEELEKAVALIDLTERIAALRKFVEDFPKSKERNRALELIVSARAALGDEKLRAGDTAGGTQLLKLAVADAPKPVSNKLFTDVILQIPTNLFVRGEQTAAIETAQLIEEKAEGNANQTLALATFYLSTENASEAKRLAEKTIALAPDLPAAYQTLGIANRLNFSLEEAANAYQKALELAPNSAVSKRNLAEMKRAVGKPDEAVALYREITAKDETDAAAQTGLILALFDAEKKDEAESELRKSLDANPNNLSLLVGAAYWYAAHNDGAKAVEFGERAIAVEPRYTWAQIALARGLISQKRFLEAEKPLLAARQYGNFPTLDYEIAAARLSAGFYREAAEDLRKSFSVKDGAVQTRLGGRVRAEAKSFTELLALERRASIFEMTAADNAETAERLKSLLDFYQKLETSTDDSAIANAADEFVRGDDKMKLHRQLFAASRMLERKKNLPKVLELTKAAIGAVDAGLDAPNAAAAVLAEELYESRKLANSRGEIIIVPEVSRQTLSSIVRGRIEDAAGWALFQDNKSAEAIVRLKRAVSVMPAKSAWWRNSMWRLGTALEADGKSKDALDAYIKSYASGEANAIRYGVVESLYQKVNGGTDGLEAKIGAKPASITAGSPVQTEATAAQKTETETPRTEPTPEPTSETKVEEKPVPTAETKPSPAPEVSPAPETKTESPVETKPEELKKEAAKQNEATAETKPTNAEIKVQPKPIENEVKAEPKPVEGETKIEEKRNETEKPAATESASKPLFEPVIISVPKTEPAKKLTDETGEKETTKAETKTAEAVQEKKPEDENGETRPRVIARDSPKEIAPCRIFVGQETILVPNNGGNLSVAVRLEGEGDIRKVKATSSSPADIEIVFEPEFGASASSRAYFSVKSISRKTGEFVVTFEAACGRKEITVKVR